MLWRRHCGTFGLWKHSCDQNQQSGCGWKKGAPDFLYWYERFTPKNAVPPMGLRFAPHTVISHWRSYFSTSHLLPALPFCLMKSIPCQRFQASSDEEAQATRIIRGRQLAMEGRLWVSTKWASHNISSKTYGLMWTDYYGLTIYRLIL